MFSVKRCQVKYEGVYNLEVNTESINQQLKRLKQIDVVYLPKTSTSLGESERQFKVYQSVYHGKFVIAPGLGTSMAFDGGLEQGLDFYHENDVESFVRQSQQKLLKLQGLPNSSAQLVRALETIEEELLDNSLRGNTY